MKFINFIKLTTTFLFLGIGNQAFAVPPLRTCSQIALQTYFNYGRQHDFKNENNWEALVTDGHCSTGLVSGRITCTYLFRMFRDSDERYLVAVSRIADALDDTSCRVTDHRRINP